MMKTTPGRSDSQSQDLIVEDAGAKLKKVRERLNLRYRDVEEASLRIAARHKNDEFALALSRLSDIENKGTIPSIYRIYSLCAIYRLDFIEVLDWYGINFSTIGTDAMSISIERTHPVALDTQFSGDVSLPIALDPGIDLRRTIFLSRVIQKWGKLPLVLLNSFDLKGHRYGFIGTEDWSMYPLIHPGSLLVIDETRRKISEDGWKTEHERPIYFVEHRKGYACGYCSIVGEQIMLQPHPSSTMVPSIFEADEIDILGQVDGVAMRLRSPRRRRSSS
jgi:transcriptional regulator with XRE-family HTH domain